MLVHGRPGSFIEFERLIGSLVADGYDVVVPSLPGYAFSGRPEAPIGPRRTAEIFHALMVELFGGVRYLLQGGDWDAAVTAWMAHDHPDTVGALHLNMVLVEARDAMPETPDDIAWAEQHAELAKEEAGYSHLQGTRPQTLGVAMSDSPVGVAAWILEKFGAWADVPVIFAKLADGSYKMPIDRVFPLSDAVAAHRHVAEGHPFGRVLMVP